MEPHAQTYKGLSAYKIIHKTRLSKIANIFKELELGKEGVWGDFGCSDGFYFYYLSEKLTNLKYWKLYGFDYEESLLELAKKRRIPNAIFIKFNLNEVNKNYQDLFDIVTSFETLEHTGNYRNAFENVYLSCKPSGFILLSAPNEIGLPGIMKFIGRKLLRRNPYQYFFKNSSEFKYFMALVRGEDIEVFRNREAICWGPHLGFNYKNFEKYIFNEYIKKEKLQLLKRASSFFGFNILYILKKIK